MSKLNFIIICLVLIGGNLKAQHYRLAAGIRIGNNYGLTVQGKIFDKTSAELILHPGLGNQENSVSLLVRRHQKFITDRLSLYAGGGITQYWKTDGSENVDLDGSGGIMGIVGAEVTLGRYNVSWDFTPSVLAWGNESGAFKAGTAVSLRYVLIKPAKKKAKSNFWKKLSPEF